jgi:type III restriction enzyme
MMLHSLPLKDYQQGVLDTLDTYLQALKGEWMQAKDFYDFQKSRGHDDATLPEKSDYPGKAWQAIKKTVDLPRVVDKKGREFSPLYHSRLDGMKREIPNLCLKIPTGGGKTLLAACALGRISRDYFKTQRGLALWIVPSKTIYNQTVKALLNREHPYRRQLDLESGGRTKILERGDNLCQDDVDHYLCVMVLMLQSFNVAANSKDARKIYSDTGRYASFFPPVDDYQANNALMNAVPNLMEADMLERNVIQGVSVKQSLGNVFRLCRPIVIIDEEHKAKSEKAIDNINEFNPRFILEFSATPRENSNRLVDIGGQNLKKEQMIKLPIHVHADGKETWQTTLMLAHDKLTQLSVDADVLHAREGTYIRPIMVIIAESKKSGDDYDQVVEIKNYLINRCQVQERQIRIKLSENDEIKNEDLLDKLCPVQYIITKDALREGWDCPFAYVLAILAPKHSETALTQYTGRVLRQPYARSTSIQSLNECYIYCSQQDVNQTVNHIKSGLENEGLRDIASHIHANDGPPDKQKRTQKRHPDYQDKIFLPRLSSVGADGKPRVFDYYRDILSDIEWQDYHYSGNPDLGDQSVIGVSEHQVDYVPTLEGEFQWQTTGRTQRTVEQQNVLNLSLLTSQLTDVIFNPFQAQRVLTEVLAQVRTITPDERVIANAQLDLVRQIIEDAKKWLIQRAEQIFIQKLETRQIMLKLMASPWHSINWDMGETRTVYQALSDSHALYDKNLFQPPLNSQYNGLEKSVAGYINASEAVKWWHRLGTKGTEYYVQGWKKEKIYPDFLILKQNGQYYFLETKGKHLKDNDDSTYKAKVLEYLSTLASKPVVGEFCLRADQQKDISFDLIYEDKWKEHLAQKGV